MGVFGRAMGVSGRAMGVSGRAMGVFGMWLRLQIDSTRIFKNFEGLIKYILIPIPFKVLF